MIGVLQRRQSGLRDRLLAVVLLATVVALIATIAGFNVLLASRLDATADDLLRTQVNTELAEVDVQQGRLTVPDFPREGAVIDEPVWIFAGRRAARGAGSTSPTGRCGCSPCRSARAAGRSARLSPPCR
jgi:hypothetical protein